MGSAISTSVTPDQRIRSITHNRFGMNSIIRDGVFDYFRFIAIRHPKPKTSTSAARIFSLHYNRDVKHQHYVAPTHLP